MDNLSAIATARDDGRKEGKEEGIAEGLEKGAKKKALETAKNFLKIGWSIEQVASGAGLSIEEVKELM